MPPPWLVPHLIFALHGLTFFVPADMLLLTFFGKVMGYTQLGDWYSALLAVLFSIYCGLAVRRVYRLGSLGAFAAGIGVMVLFLIVLILYRQSITIWTLLS